MTIRDARLQSLFVVRPAKAARVRELKADDDQVISAIAKAVLVRTDQAFRAIRAMPPLFSSLMMSWFGFARPSGRTAIASPP